MSTQVVITSFARTPIGSFLGGLKSLEAHELGAVAMKAALERSKVEPSEVNEVIVGQLLTAGKGPNTGRQAACIAGIPFSVPTYTINMLCGSGLKTVMLAFQAIRNGDAKILLCGGQESMSRAEHTAYLRQGMKMGPLSLQDSLFQDALTCAFIKEAMGITAENVASEYNVPREDQDRFALESQRRADSANKSGKTDQEIIPVSVPGTRRGSPPEIVSRDEHPRPETSLETLSKLRPAFSPKGSVTVGNASGMNDAAAFCVVMEEGEAVRRGLVPLLSIVAIASVGVEPRVMGIAPVPAIIKAVEKAGWSLEDVDLFEINEAFAAQSLAVVRELGLDPEKVNIYGGAIALGHPLGASGTKILGTLAIAMKERKARRGVAALCVGGGLGVAMCLERRPNWD